jgi:hypothetical protein
VIKPQKLARKGVFWGVKKTKLIPENQPKMEQYELLIIPESL